MTTALHLFRDAYLKACEGSSPHAYVLAQCDRPDAEQLLCGGRDRGEHPRLDTTAAANAASAMSRGGHPFTLVDFSSSQLTSGCVDPLVKLLQDDSTIETLSLSNNDLGPEDITALCGAASKNVILRELDFGSNTAGAEGGLAAADMLQQNSTLKTLRLGNCSLDTQGIIAIATVLQGNSTLELLDISRPLATAQQMEEALSHIGRMLSSNTALIQLDLSKCRIRDHGLSMIASALLQAGSKSRLSSLFLRCNEISLRESDAVGEFGKLMASYACHLVRLDLSANRLQDDGALILSEQLNSNSTLTHLDITHNSITSCGLCALGPVLARHRSITTVAVIGNRFDSAACRSWLPALQTKLKVDFGIQEVDGVYSCVPMA